MSVSSLYSVHDSKSNILLLVWCSKYNYVKITLNSFNASFGPCDHTQMALDSEYELS